jgi:hypothetical protein
VSASAALTIWVTRYGSTMGAIPGFRRGYTKKFLLIDMHQTAFNMLPFVSKIRYILISLRHSVYHIDCGFPEALDNYHSQIVHILRKNN